ncbi:hypothetical protein CMUS01_14141 [Colletotrichum musicola]|uniref:LysM domain-containing protein n=1 Tax=Colletotrichum musicola TaxID=2175873 RepID=A0A8H6MSD0_9PEZI|nr:hypothetical protein CMUS01_14141 [Colletotrichum musicola]
MRLTPSFILAAALFDLGSAIPAEAAGLGPAGRGGPGGMHGPQQPSPGDLPGVPATGDGNGVSVASQSQVEISTNDEARFAVKCDQRGWTYLYSWWPLMNEVCEEVGDRTSGDWLGTYPASHPYVGENKQVVFGWNISGPPDKCKYTCRQVFTALHNHAPCLAEKFWMKEQAELMYEGCGMAWYNVEYTLGPMPDHGTLLCWDQPSVPSYKPDPLAVQRFCSDAIFSIRKAGNEFLSLYERVGFFWTDYSRQVSRPEAPNTYFDTGFVHFWVKPTQYRNVCGPGENILGQLENLSVEGCVKHMESIEKQQNTCAAPSQSSLGGRLWANCFEWGIKASGYDGIKTPTSAKQLSMD